MANQTITSGVTVSAGNTLTDADILRAGGQVYILSGGSGVRLSAYGNGYPSSTEGSIIVSAGGRVTSSLLSGGYMAVAGANAYAEHTTITAKGWQDVGYNNNGTYAVGVTSDTVIQNSGAQFVYGLGTTFATHVSAGGTQGLMAAGAKAYNTEVLSGGSMYVSAGGQAYNPSIDINGQGQILSGGTVVASNGAATGVSILAGGSGVVLSGGVLSRATAASLVFVSSGGSFADSTITNGGTGVISAGGAATGISILAGGSGLVLSGGVLSRAIVSAAVTVSSGGSIVDSNINLGGTGVIQAGGSAVNVTVSGIGRTGSTVNSGGRVYLYSGAVISGATISGGYIGVRGSATNVTVTNSGWMDVGNNGWDASAVAGADSASNTVLLSGGQQYVYGTATTSATQVSAGGTQLLISAGAKAYATQVLSGGTMSVAAGTAYNPSVDINGVGQISAGGTVVASNGIATGVSILAGGSGLVLSGGVLSRATASAAVTVSSGGSIVDSNINLGGTGVILAGGSATNVTVSGIGRTGSTVNSGGRVYLYSGAAISGATISGGYLGVRGSATNVTVTNSGWMDVGNNGWDASAVAGADTASNTVLLSGGQQYVYGTATTSATQVSAGGTQLLISVGAKAYATEIFSGGSTLLASGTLLSGGNIQAGGYVSAAAGGMYNGSIAVRGSMVGGTVGTGGVVEVFSGGVASGPIQVVSGGSLQVDSGGTLTGLASLSANGLASIGTNAGGTINLAATNFSQVSFVGSGSFTTKLTGFNGTAPSASDRILLKDVPKSSIVGVSYPTKDQVSFLLKDGSSIVLNIVGVQNYGFDLSDDGSGGTVFAVCYLEGTMIDTPDGEKPIQSLRIGDLVCVYRQNVREVRIISGCGSKKIAHAPDDDAERYLVCFKKDSLAPLSPHTDLFVTPEHCIFIDGYFVPARMLVNGVSIFHDTKKKEYTYYHIETEDHSIIMANGVLSESYLNTGNIDEFDDFSSQYSERLRVWASHAAAPLNTTREFVEPIWARLAKDITRRECNASDKKTEVDLYLETIHGERILPSRIRKDKYIFSIPVGTDLVYLCSDSAVPSSAIGPYVNDRRRLGAFVSDIHLYGAQRSTQIDVNSFLVHARGWHNSESEGGRWTKGRAVLPIRCPDFPDNVRILAVDVPASFASL